MIAVADFVAEVRSLVDTPFQHRGRLPHIGLDCVGVAIAAARRCGLEVQEPPPYGEIPNGLIAGLRTYCDEVPREEAREGDLVAIFWSNEPRHLAVIVDRRRDGSVWVVRACGHAGRVRCAPLTLDIRAHSFWRVRGVG